MLTLWLVEIAYDVESVSRPVGVFSDRAKAEAAGIHAAIGNHTEQMPLLWLKTDIPYVAVISRCRIELFEVTVDVLL